MKFFLAMLAVAAAYDCDDCSNNCRWWFQSCYWDKVGCRLYGLPVRVFLDNADALCETETVTDDDMAIISAGKNILIEKGYFTESDFQGRTIKICPLLGGGVTVSAQTMIIDDGYRTRSPLEVASIVAHEMYHAVYQYEELGLNTFSCLYRSELEMGNGLGRGNAMEDPAYEFQDAVNKCLFEGEGCPKN